MPRPFALMPRAHRRARLLSRGGKPLLYLMYETDRATSRKGWVVRDYATLDLLSEYHRTLPEAQRSASAIADAFHPAERNQPCPN